MPHYYDRLTGQLLPSEQIKSGPNAGNWREPTLADARKVNALVSVTTVLSMLSKPGLVQWQVEQGIKAATTFTWGEDGDYTPDQIRLVYEDSLKYTRWTQDFGTAVHWWVSYKLHNRETNELPPLMPKSEEVAEGFLQWSEANGYIWERTEHQFLRPDLGYAGTVDLLGTHYGMPCIADLKTQERPLTPYPEYAYQLAGYDYALTLRLTNGAAIGGGGRERISLIADRDHPGQVHQKLWVDKGSTVEATNARFDRIWMSMLELWMMVNKYDPRNVE